MQKVSLFGHGPGGLSGRGLTPDRVGSDGGFHSTNKNIGNRTQVGNTSMGNVNPRSGFRGNRSIMTAVNRPNADMITGTRPSGYAGAAGSKTMGAGSSDAVGRSRR